MNNTVIKPVIEFDAAEVYALTVTRRDPSGQRTGWARIQTGQFSAAHPWDFNHEIRLYNSTNIERLLDLVLADVRVLSFKLKRLIDVEEIHVKKW